MPKTEEEHTDVFYIRVEAVLRMLLKNERYMDSNRASVLQNSVMEKFKCGDRTARRIISEARKKYRAYGQIENEKIFKKNRKRAIRNREFLYAEAVEAGDLKTALIVAKDRDEILGLYEQKIKQSGEVTVKNIDMSQFTEYGLEKLKRGEKLEEVLLDPKSLKQNADTNANSSRS